eukprot:jgi/Chlat1/1709/Chrsp127S01938
MGRGGRGEEQGREAGVGGEADMEDEVEEEDGAEEEEEEEVCSWLGLQQHRSRRKSFPLGLEFDSDSFSDDGDFVVIGNVRVYRHVPLSCLARNIHDDRSRQRGRKAPVPLYESGSSESNEGVSSMDSEAIDDYLEGLEVDDEDQEVLEGIVARLNHQVAIEDRPLGPLDDVAGDDFDDPFGDSDSEASNLSGWLIAGDSEEDDEEQEEDGEVAQETGTTLPEAINDSPIAYTPAPHVLGEELDIDEILGNRKPPHWMRKRQQRAQQRSAVLREGLEDGEKEHRRREQMAGKRALRAQMRDYKASMRDATEAKSMSRSQRVWRGFDVQSLQVINNTLADFVETMGDMWAFPPMDKVKRLQLHKLAGLFKLKSSSQGSGKKRFTVVTRTPHSFVPDHMILQDYMQRLLVPVQPVADRGSYRSSLTADVDEDIVDDDGLSYERQHRARKAVKANRAARRAAAHERLIWEASEDGVWRSKRRHSTGGDVSTSKSKSRRRAEGISQVRRKSYARPMEFVSSGVIADEGPSVSQPLMASSHIVTTQIVHSTHIDQRNFGEFEQHTTGFGSKMLAKMGFSGAGTGLGSGGTGIREPIKALMRPKSLGLGA